MTEIELAKNLCVEAHAGQFRRDGVTPYHTHPFAVAEKVPDELKPAAYLHDVLEDSTLEFSLEHIKMISSQQTLDAVIALTRFKNETYHAYMARLMDNPDAVIIKIADMEHNLSCQPSERSVEKIAMYLPVLKEKARSWTPQETWIGGEGGDL